MASEPQSTAPGPEPQSRARRRTVLALALATTLIYAAFYYSFAAFLAFWEADFGWSKPALAGAFTLALLVSAACAPLAGTIIDRGHGRALMAGTALLGAGGLALLTQVETQWQFYALWLVIGVAMAGGLYDACFSLVTHLFPEDARRAITLITLIGGFAGPISFPVGVGIAEAAGWRIAALVLAGLVALLAAPAVWFAPMPVAKRDRADRAAEREDRRSALGTALGTRIFWLLLVTYALGFLNHGTIVNHLLPLLSERGVSLETAVLAASMIGPMQVAGRLAMMLAERYFRPPMIVVAGVTYIGLMLASAALLGAALWPVLLIGFVVFQGAGHGLASISRPVLLAEGMGRGAFGAINGVVGAACIGAYALAPTLAALVWELGGYTLVLYASFAAAAISLATLIAAAHARRGAAGRPDG